LTFGDFKLCYEASLTQLCKLQIEVLKDALHNEGAPEEEPTTQDEAELPP
jgi:hypothetical protein